MKLLFKLKIVKKYAFKTIEKVWSTYFCDFGSLTNVLLLVSTLKYDYTEHVNFYITILISYISMYNIVTVLAVVLK